MDETDKTILSNQAKFRLDERKNIEAYFNSEINERKLYRKKLNKYVTTLNYINKILIILSATSGGVCIISHANVVGASIGIASAGFTIVFASATGVTKKLLKTTKNKKKKQDEIFMLAKSRLSSIESLVSWALIYMEINQEEFIAILKEKDKSEKMEENVRNVSEKLEEKQENIRLNNVNSREIPWLYDSKKDFIDLFLLNDFEKNDIILKYF